MEDRSLEPIAVAAVKVVALICVTITLIFFSHSCQLDEVTMEECKKACGSWSGIKEVTSKKCECNGKNQSKISTSPWVLPGN